VQFYKVLIKYCLTVKFCLDVIVVHHFHSSSGNSLKSCVSKCLVSGVAQW